MTLGWAIVGLGRHADQKIAPAINRASNARLVAVCSRDAERARAFAQRHGAERAFDSYPEMVRHPGVDAVFIASPNALHKEHTLLAAEAGRHVLCEKPLALTVEDARAMVEACEKRGVKLGVGFHLRHHPAHVAARNLVRQGLLGRLVLVQASWSVGRRGEVEVPPYTGLMSWWNDPQMVGGGAIMARGVHLVDLLRYVTGREVEEVKAYTDTDERRPLDTLLIALLRLEDDLFGMLCTSRRIPDPFNDLVIYGSHGRIHSRDTVSTEFGGRLEVSSQGLEQSTGFEKGDMYLDEIEAFGQAVLEGRQPEASGIDGLKVVAVTQALLESARTGKAVPVPQV